MVDIAPVKKLKREVSLTEIRAVPELEDMILVRQSRLSVQPVTEKEFDLILRLSDISG